MRKKLTLLLAMVLVTMVSTTSCSKGQPITIEEFRAQKKAKKEGKTEQEDPLAQEVSVSFDYESLGSVRRSLTVLSGVDISVHPEVMPPEEQDRRIVSMDVAGMQFRHVLDWLVREMGVNYQVRNDGSVWMTVDYTPLDEVVTASEFVPLLFVEKEMVDLIAILNSSIYPVTLKCDDITFTPREDRNLLVVQAPRAALDRIHEIIEILGSNEPAPLPAPADMSYMAVLEKSIECDFGLVSLKDISVKLRETTGLNVGYRTDLVQKKIVKNKIFMGLGEMPVAQALDEIALRFGFAKWDLEKGRGIWFRGEAEDPYPPSGEVPWHGTVVRAYPLGELVGQRDPDEIVRTVREVCGRSSPGALVEYSRGTGKLLVIEEPAMIERVEEYLRIAVLAARATKTP